jgi:hypothetical protein
MDGSVEEPLPSTLGALAVAEILRDVGDQARIENTFAIACGIKAAIQVQVSAFEVETDLLGHLLQRFQALWEQNHVSGIDGRYRDRR